MNRINDVVTIEKVESFKLNKFVSTQRYKVYMKSESGNKWYYTLVPSPPNKGEKIKVYGTISGKEKTGDGTVVTFLRNVRWKR